MTNRKIGAHVSAAGGHFKAVERVAEIGCNTLQIFSGSPRVWAKPKLEAIDTVKFFSTQKMLKVNQVITHALYLINLASDKPENVQKSINALIYELTFDSLIKGAGVVVHLGSHTGRGWEAVKDQVATAVSTILEKTPEDSTFLIENSAGQNGKLCSDLNEIRWLLDQVNSPRLGWCIDTCHAHAAGFVLSPTSSFPSFSVRRSNLNEVLTNDQDEISRAKGEEGKTSGSKNENMTNGERGKVLDQEITKLDLWSTLHCIHVNDSKDEFDSGRDRHANLGEGNIPMEDFKHFLNLEQVQNIPLILEVPGFDNEGPDKQNVDILKKLVE